MVADILTVERLKAYYLMNYFGVQREVRAVDDITMRIGRNEVYGIAGESSSGKTSFIKVLAAAIRPREDLRLSRSRPRTLHLR